MRRCTLAGIEVSVFALGAAGFGGVGSARRLVGKGESAAEAHALLDCAAALGVDLVDTAGTYGDGASEEILGAWLRARGPAVRHRVRLASKVGLRGGLGRRHVLAEVERSLRRLGVDALDFYLAHLPDPATPWAEVRATFELLVQQGKVRRFGVSNVTAADLQALRQAGVVGGAAADAEAGAGFGFVQNQLNLLHREDAADPDHGVLATCRRLGLSYTAYSPLAGGLLSGKYALEGAISDDSRAGLRPDLHAGAWTPANARRVAQLRTEAAARAVSPAGLATWWLLHCPHVTSIALGARRPAQLETLVGEALGLAPDLALWRRLAELPSAPRGATP